MNMEDVLIKIVLSCILGTLLGYVGYIVLVDGVFILIGIIAGVMGGSYIAERFL